MTIFDMPNYLWITILGMILLTVIYTLVLNKWFQSAIITFVVLAVLAFFIPNFQSISYQPLLGYAGFLGIMSLIISFLIWYFSRNWRKNRRKIKLEKEIRKYDDE
ncbi:membrane protein, partial [Staphylococcus epidermidis CIM37]